MAQQLKTTLYTLVGAGIQQMVANKNEQPYAVTFIADKGNGSAIHIGGDDNDPATHGYELTAGDSLDLQGDEVAGSMRLLDLSSFRVKGPANSKVRIIYLA